MKKYFLSCLCLFVVSNYIFISCSASEDGAGSIGGNTTHPIVKTSLNTLVNMTHATCGGTVISDGGGVGVEGVCWSLTQNPTIEDNKTEQPGALGAFVSEITGLAAHTKYYVRAYASNSAGVGYGDQISFITTNSEIGLPTVTTKPATEVAATTVNSGGNVTETGGADITARGVCWATTSGPTTANSTAPATGTTGEFTSSITGLTPSTTYYLRAFATNSGGTGYGAEITFTTTAATTALPTITTTAATEITATTATSGGNVTAEGGAAVTARGICFGTTENPTTSNTVVAATGTTGSFVSQLTGLVANTTYYVRAFATNSGGTAYGTQINFTTTTGSTTAPTGGNAICDGSHPTTVVAVTSTTGKIWMDRNLGASRAATTSKDFESYGCLYQWGRGNDGHASVVWTLGEEGSFGEQPGTAVNGSTYTLSTSDTPPDALFIKNETDLHYDWRSPKNDNLWQGASGINNPCPSGYRLPTRAEFKAELTAYSVTGVTSAFNSILKLPTAGERAFDSASIRGQGTEIWFWTSTTDDLGDSYNISVIGSSEVYSNVANGRAGGFSVRCIKN